MKELKVKTNSIRSIFISAGILILMSFSFTGCNSFEYNFYEDSVLVEERKDDRHDFISGAYKYDESEMMTNIDLTFEDSSGTFSDDGSIYVNWKNNAYLVWNTVTGTQSPMVFMNGSVLKIVISPDNKELLIYGTFGFRIQDIESQKTIYHSLKPLNGPLNQMGYTSDGQFFYICTIYEITNEIRKTYISFWKADTRQFVRKISWESRETWGGENIAFSKDNKYFAAGHTGRTITVFRLETGEIIQNIDIPTYYTNNIAFSADGTAIISEGLSKWLTCHRISDGKLIWKKNRDKFNYYDLVVSENGNSLWTFGRQNGDMEFIEERLTSSGKLLRTYTEDDGYFVNEEMGSNSGYRVLKPDESGYLLFSHKNETIQDYSFGSGLSREISILSSGGSLASSNKVNIIPSSNPGYIKILRGDFSNSGNHNYASIKGKTLDVWDIKTGSFHHSFNLPGDEERIIHSMFESQILTDDPEHEGILEIWDLDSENRIEILNFSDYTGVPTSRIRDIAIQKQGRLLAILAYGKSDYKDETLHVWDRTTHKFLYTMDVDSGMDVYFSLTGEIITVHGGSIIGNDFKAKDYFFKANTGDTQDESNYWNYFPDRDKYKQFFIERKLFKIQVNGNKISLHNTSNNKFIELSKTNKGDWFVTLPDGRFDCSDGGRQFIQFTKGTETFKAGQFWDQFYTPGLLASFLNGGEIENGNTEISEVLDFAPTVTIQSPDNMESLEETVKVTVLAEAKGNGLGDVFLYINGKTANSDTRGLSVISNGSSRQFIVTLREGENSIKAAAFDADHQIEGWSQEIKITYKPVKIIKPDLYILSIGVSDYEDVGIRLNSPDDDARTIAKLFNDTAQGLYGKVYKEVLTDKQANMTEIRRVFENILSRTEPKDTVILFFAGHGYTEDKVYYYLPQEAEITDLPGTSLSINEIGNFTNQLAATKIAILFDTCQSGDAAISLGRIAMSRGFDERKAIADLAKKSGIIVFAATSPGADAYEIEELGHGIFTYSIITALREKTGLIARNSRISINRLMTEVEQLTRETGYIYLNIEQNPIKYNFGEDFDIGLIK
jgi:WD40 repeat protein